jgi:hypothetical protein
MQRDDAMPETTPMGGNVAADGAREAAAVTRDDLAGRDDVAALLDRSTALAAAWGARAASSTTIGQERAILRLFGVAGLDRAGRPLAAEVVDRYLAPDPRRLGGGIALPFAMAMAEYDLPPQELALEVAAGNVDLGLEAELLAEPDRRSVAVADATNLARAATERIDANRTARRELIALLGDRPGPLVGMALGSPAIVDAIDEARQAIDAGARLVRVDVPPGRELAERMARLGSPLERWRAAPSSRGGLEAPDPSGQPIPSGAQRALAVLRRYLDEAGARGSGYIRLMTRTPALASPDQAVVAAFERVDLVTGDPMGEIITGRVDPDRALADHVFANRLLARAGTRVVVPAGPLAVAQDLQAGIPSDAATRAGRALVLQLLAVAITVGSGLAPGDVIVDAVPPWIGDEPDAPARALAEVMVRRALLPDHPLAFLEPALDDAAALRWHAMAAVALIDAPGAEVIVRRPGGESGTSIARTAASGAAATAAAGLWSSRLAPAVRGPSAAHLTAIVRAANATLDLLERSGWAALVDQPMALPVNRLGAEAVAERTTTFDVLAPAPTSAA